MKAFFIFLACLLAGISHADTLISQCGTIITEPGKYKVSSDLLACVGNPNIYGAITVLETSDVQIDLNGHEITCAPTDGVIDAGIGVLFSSEVKVTNGTVSFCDIGLLMFGTTSSMVADLTLRNNVEDPIFGGGIGIYLESSSKNKLTGNLVSQNASGIVLSLSDKNLVSGNTANENIAAGFRGNTGIGVIGNENIIRGNEASLNAIVGILVRFPSTGNLVQGNNAWSNGVFGIGAGGFADFGDPIAAGNVFKGNTSLGHFWDLAEHLIDIANESFLPSQACNNTWKGNEFVSTHGPNDCFD